VSARYVALIRGINVGRAKRVAMADLRAMIEALGYADVRTLLNSGNAVFAGPRGAAARAAAQIEAGLAGSIGVPARVTVLTADDLATVVAENPFADVATDASRLLVTVLTNPADGARLDALVRQDWAPDALAVGSRAAYLWCAGGILESRLPEATARILRDGATSRNWATMLKLQALV
jgi:uncharacterized protein (DUF1697 family)